MKNKITIAILTILLFAPAVYPCGAPTEIYGQMTTNVLGLHLPVYQAAVVLEAEGITQYSVPTNPFGWYRFPAVLPCSPYTVRASHKRFAFQPFNIPPEDFDDGHVRVDLVGTPTGLFSNYK